MNFNFQPVPYSKGCFRSSLVALKLIDMFSYGSLRAQYSNTVRMRSLLEKYVPQKPSLLQRTDVAAAQRCYVTVRSATGMLINAWQGEGLEGHDGSCRRPGR